MTDNKTAGSAADTDNPIGVVIGDSIAEGHPATHGRLHADDSGRADLSLKNVPGQQSYYYEQETNCRVYNHGIGSQTAAQIRARWRRDVLAQADASLEPASTLPGKPAFVVLVCGINDVWAGRSADDITEDIAWMAESAVSNGIYPIVFNIGPDFDMDDGKLRVIKAVNARLEEKYGGSKKIMIFDYYSFANDPGSDGFPKKGLFTDNVHPAAETVRQIAGIVIRQSGMKDWADNIKQK